MKRFFKTRSSKGQNPKGQNLVEFAMTLPFILVFLLFIVEVGRVWFFYEALKMAAMDGAHSAAIYHNPQVGRNQVIRKLQVAAVAPQSVDVTQVPNQHAYQVSVTANFQPLFGAIQLPFVGAQMFGAFPISYTALKEYSVY